MTGSCQFFDGHSAKPQAVSLSFPAGGGIAVTGAEGHVIASWPAKGLTLTEQGADRLLISHKMVPDARIVVTDPALVAAALGAKRRKAQRVSVPIRGRQRAFWAGLALVLVLLAGGGLYGLMQTAQWTPYGLRQSLGEGMLNAMTGSRTKCSDPAAQAALDDLAARLSLAAEGEEPVKVALVDWDLVNAFALPGGYVVLTSGLLNHVAGPDELAGVLAHEVAHVIERHPTEALLRGVGLSLVAAFVGGDFTGVLAEMGSELLMLANSRSDEAEADERAQDMLHALGYSALGLQSFLANLPQDNGMEILSTHPDPGARAKSIEDPAGFTAKQPFEGETWRRIKTACDASA